MTTQEPQELAVESARAGEQRALGSITVVSLEPATVQSFTEQVPATVTVRPDAAMTDVPARSLLNYPLYPGARVMVAWTPEGGCLVMGYIGRVQTPYGLMISTTTQSGVADNVDTTITFPTPRLVQAGVTEASDAFRLPYTGLWDAYADVVWNNEPAGATPGYLHERSAYIERLDAGGTIVENLARAATAEFTNDGVGRWFEAMNLPCTGFPMNAGDQVRLRVKQAKPFGGGVSVSVLAAKLSVKWAGMTADVVA